MCGTGAQAHEAKFENKINIHWTTPPFIRPNHSKTILQFSTQIFK